MRPSDATPETNIRPSLDWRGWIILAWVVWFGLLYGKMVVEQRGGKLRDWVRDIGPSGAASR